jgi:putative CocE/NonD family hydrolase
LREIENDWIRLSDGTRLAARIWLPDDAERSPVPAILEYLPYRKSDATSLEDAARHPYFASRGYAAVRVDIRGSGDSGGILTDEYSVQEQDDALEVLTWLAEQPWCDGNVGMMGISWGGFNSLQVAARNPPQLKAIISACSTDDRYDNDVHYMGGKPLAYYTLPWAAVMLAYNARPPDPSVVGDRWRDMWLERLEGNRFLADTWLRHQRRDAYWQQGSICENYSSVRCPVLLVGGWADAYTDAIFRMLDGLTCVRKALIGPWAHVWPEDGVPGPAVDFQAEAVAWWDRWLKGVDNGVHDLPAIRAWMQDAVPPRSFYSERPGRWVAEERWPSERTGTLELWPDGESLAAEPPAGGSRTHSSPQTVGLDGGAWCSYGNPGDLPVDQRRDDALSMSFTSAPLEQPVELLGAAELRLSLEVDQPVAFVAARLCAVAPGGESTLLSRGVMNLCQRDSRSEPEALVPGKRYDVRVSLKATSCALPAGHRLRVALSTSWWPIVWPSPRPVAVTLRFGPGTAVRLPLRRTSPGEPEVDPLPPPPERARPPFEWLRPRDPHQRVTRDLATGEVVVDSAWEFFGGRRLAGGLEYDYRDPVRFTIREDDPLSARVTTERHISIARGDWRTRIAVESEMTADEESFHLRATLDSFDGDERIFSRTYACEIPRDHA